jgi:hypothetical protein
VPVKVEAKLSADMMNFLDKNKKWCSAFNNFGFNFLKNLKKYT